MMFHNIFYQTLIISLEVTQSLTDLTQIILYRVYQNSHVLSLTDRVIYHLIRLGTALLFALTTVRIIASFTLFTIDVAALKTNTIFHHLNTVITGHSIHQGFQRCVQISHTFVN